MICRRTAIACQRMCVYRARRPLLPPDLYHVLTDQALSLLPIEAHQVAQNGQGVLAQSWSCRSRDIGSGEQVYGVRAHLRGPATGSSTSTSISLAEILASLKESSAV
mgnify:CR=1 FL=1